MAPQMDGQRRRDRDGRSACFSRRAVDKRPSANDKRETGPNAARLEIMRRPRREVVIPSQLALGLVEGHHIDGLA